MKTDDVIIDDKNYTELTGEWVMGLLELEKEGKLSGEWSGGKPELGAVPRENNWTELEIIEEGNEVAEEGDEEMEASEGRVEDEGVVVDGDEKTNDLVEEVEIAPTKEVVEKPKYPAHLSKEIPMTDENVLASQKEPITSGFKWLGAFYRYVLKSAGIDLKKNKDGTVTRVPLKKPEKTIEAPTESL